MLWGADSAAGGQSGVALLGLALGALGALVVLAVFSVAALIYAIVCALRLRAAPGRCLSRTATAMLLAMLIAGASRLVGAASSNAWVDHVAHAAALAGAVAFAGYLLALATHTRVPQRVPFVAAALLFAPWLVESLGVVLAPAFLVMLPFKPALALAVMGTATAVAIIGALVLRAQIKTLADALDALPVCT